MGLMRLVGQIFAALQVCEYDCQTLFSISSERNLQRVLCQPDQSPEFGFAHAGLRERSVSIEKFQRIEISWGSSSFIVALFSKTYPSSACIVSTYEILSSNFSVRFLNLSRL